ncbi:MAG: GH3 auxin-responsive promoter family protein [Cytophagales bacterium]|jgi:acyl-CoA synthetase (AMP-forming)/AMP-acid ligase II|nr:GH3 auxin-responsive promoter family protein [Cytophagales bacterium]
MSLIDFCAKTLTNFLSESQINNSRRAEDTQRNILTHLINIGEKTKYWQEKGIKNIRSYLDFKQQVPLVTYEDLVHYIDRIKQGEPNVLWLGKPTFLAKTSGTTGNVKYVPVTNDFVHNYTLGAKQTLCHYLKNLENKNFYAGKMMFLTGSPRLDEINGILIGRLSGISNHLIPWYLKKKYIPSFETNCIEDWEEKISKIAQETIGQNITLLAGIPPWLQMYFDKVMELSGEKVGEVFKNLSVIIYGGMRFEPYKQRFFESIGRKVDMFETYATSEGYIASQYSLRDNDMLLMLDNDIFYEFVPVKNLEEENPIRLKINEVSLNEEYAIIISTTSGLWGYILGDTVKFTSLDPFKIIITGRIKHFISVFGEHVTVEEIENAMAFALEKHPETKIFEYTVAPHVGNNNEKLSYHEWFFEFIAQPKDINVFMADLNSKMCEQNCYYKDLITGNVLQRLRITELKRDCFNRYLKSVGKFGDQNKIQRVSNGRTFAEGLLTINGSFC